jgi:WD40 repeat protein
MRWRRDILFLGDECGRVWVLDGGTLLEVTSFQAHDLVITDLTVIDDATIATTSQDMTLRSWAWQRGELLKSVDLADLGVSIARVSAHHLAVGTEGGVQLWDMRGFKHIRTLDGAGPTAVVPDRDGVDIVTTEVDRAHQAKVRRLGGGGGLDFVENEGVSLFSRSQHAVVPD